jgi:hypothetical protein
MCGTRGELLRAPPERFEGGHWIAPAVLALERASAGRVVALRLPDGSEPHWHTMAPARPSRLDGDWSAWQPARGKGPPEACFALRQRVLRQAAVPPTTCAGAAPRSAACRRMARSRRGYPS